VKLHTVFVTFNRLELTKITIESYLETVSVPYTYVVMDNASEDGTKEWLLDWGHPYESFTRNRYPGYAANRGWERAPEDATHLQRADNDFRYLPGWCEEVERIFRTSKVGQVGLRTDEEEGYEPANTGGNCVIRKELFDQGIRYDETPWPEIWRRHGVGYSEDSFFSALITARGYTWTRVKKHCIDNLASGDWSDEYYRRSYGARGIRPGPNDPTVPEGFIPYDS
jgi:glycosyltransferase involved in cell wall biosynthesis